MKWRKVLAAAMAATMALGATACGSADDAATKDGKKDTQAGSTANNDGVKSYADIKLGEDYTDLTATISLFNHRTDLESDDYKGTKWSEYLAEFNKMYPNITVNLTTDTNYADDALTHLQSGDYETVMMIPAVDKADLSNYFLSYGDIDTMKS